MTASFTHPFFLQLLRMAQLEDLTTTSIAGKKIVQNPRITAQPPPVLGYRTRGPTGPGGVGGKRPVQRF